MSNVYPANIMPNFDYACLGTTGSGKKTEKHYSVGRVLDVMAELCQLSEWHQYLFAAYVRKHGSVISEQRLHKILTCEKPEQKRVDSFANVRHLVGEPCLIHTNSDAVIPLPPGLQLSKQYYTAGDLISKLDRADHFFADHLRPHVKHYNDVFMSAKVTEIDLPRLVLFKPESADVGSDE